MTPTATEKTIDESSTEWVDLKRRSLLKALGTAVTLSANSGVATAGGEDNTDDAVATIQARTHAEYGDILVDSDEMTLYMFDQDAQGGDESACHDDCATGWPPLTVDSEPTAGDGVVAEVATVERETRSVEMKMTGNENGALEYLAVVSIRETQATANGWPLYHFARDEEPGDANGQGANGVWWVLQPDGTPIRSD